MKPFIPLAACMSVLVPSFATAQDPTAEQLQQRIQQLEQRIIELERQQTQLSADHVDAVVERVLRDADRRSQWLLVNGGFTAGFDKGRFFLRSEDGNYLLMPGFVFQTRYTANWQHGGDDNIDSGFEIRRMRLIFEGNAITPKLQYKFQWESRNTDGGVFLQDAWARYALTPNWKIQIGQFKDAIHHEEAMADQFVLTADRSFINALIGGGNIDRIQGVMLMYDDLEHFRVNLVAHDGYNTKNTDFTESGGGTNIIGITNLNFGLSARAEYTVMGIGKQYDDFTALGNQQDLLVFGAGVNWSQGGDSDVIFHTIDAQWENTNGLGVYGALLGLYREIGDDSTIPAGDFYDYGALVQAGYLVTEKVEVFGRYEYIDVDEDSPLADSGDTLQEVTIGANYFWYGHNARFTLDLSWLPNGSPVSLPALGILASGDDQFVLRLQAQLVL